jgi:GNAT superfamily N-acetyltransferase
VRQTRTPGALHIRAYSDGDLSSVLDLLRTTLGHGPGGERSAAFLRWKHIENPFGRSFMLVAEEDGRIVGLRAFLRWEFVAGSSTIRAVRAVDTATHPEHQGRGIFSELTRRALEDVRRETDLVFNTPNGKSLPGYLKMGWRVVGRVPVRVRPRRPLRVLRGLSSLGGSPVEIRAGPPVTAPTAREALRTEGLSPLLEQADRWDSRLSTPRDLTFLRWRYGDAPLGYHAVLEEQLGELTGLAIFRVRPRGRLWETTVAEALVRPGDRGTAGRLLRRMVGAAAVDHVTCAFPSGSPGSRAARRRGFLASPQAITVVMNPLTEVVPDPTDLSSWAFSLGDLEVF